MKAKYFVHTLLFVSFSIGVFAQPAVISVLINGKKIGERAIKENSDIIPVHKVKFKNVSSITLIYKQMNVSNVYKRSIDITNQSDRPLYHVQESKLKPGWFNISIPMARRIILKEKKIKLYLLEDPANDMMTLPSRRKLLIELHFINGS
jgi:hypothetical protein